MNSPLRTRWSGRISFPSALALQERILQEKRIDSTAPDELLLLEHDPVYTIGRTPDQSSLRGTKRLPHPVFEINRGGQATYHGPGQLVGYFLLDLRRYGQDLHRYLRWLETLLIELLAHYEIQAMTREGLTGVWIENRKIGSIGVGVRHWITMHGFALNVCGDLSPFSSIVPCGLTDVTMTSMEIETGVVNQVEHVARKTAALAEERLSLLQNAMPSTAPLAVL